METDQFAQERPRLLGLAYRLLGSVIDAEDVVQDAWLRWQRADRSEIDNPAAWLTTVTSRLGLDRLRAQQRRKEDYVGPWLPEPFAGGPGPEERAELAESLTLGFLAVLDRLGPVERAVFLLADVFGEPFPSIARSVGRSEDACRQIASRARRRVREERAGARAADRGLLEKLVLAISAGEVDRVIELLAPEIVLVSDGGANRHAARRPIVGRERVARYLVNLAGRWSPEDGTAEIADVNGAPALVLRFDAAAPVVMTSDRVGDRVVTIRLVVNPEKLGALDRPVTLS
ncbi:MAG TPA: RNA polymerase sigma factor SigJ [Acidimicrobiales bacterium]|nr:RNA polymerase sigma factor SigJ [Acidimicrobiales bacterium]